MMGIGVDNNLFNWIKEHFPEWSDYLIDEEDGWHYFHDLDYILGELGLTVGEDGAVYLVSIRPSQGNVLIGSLDTIF